MQKLRNPGRNSGKDASAETQKPKDLGNKANVETQQKQDLENKAHAETQTPKNSGKPGYSTYLNAETRKPAKRQGGEGDQTFLREGEFRGKRSQFMRNYVNQVLHL